MMTSIKGKIAGLIGLLQGRYALYKIRRLRGSSRAEVANLYSALEASLSLKIKDDELALIQRIENLRADIAHSGREIHFTDYGAGDPDAARTEEECLAGVKAIKKLSEVITWSKPFFWGMFMFKMIRLFRPDKCLELGTCVGISGSYIASALQLSSQGTLVTLEGDQSLADIAREDFQRLGLGNTKVVAGRFNDTLADVLKSDGPFDFVFIDGHHDEIATIDYYQRILPHLSAGALVVFDDIAWSAGMKRAWNKLKVREEFCLTADLTLIGVCVVGDTGTQKVDIAVPLGFVGATKELG